MKNLKEVLQPSTSSGPRLAPEPPSVYDLAEQFLKLKMRREKLDAEISEVQGALEPELAKIPGMTVAVGSRDVMLIPVAKETCDLEAAKKRLGRAKLAPYIENIEKLDLKAAKKHLDLTAFITVTHSTQLRTPERKGTK